MGYIDSSKLRSCMKFGIWFHVFFLYFERLSKLIRQCVSKGRATMIKTHLLSCNVNRRDTEVQITLCVLIKTLGWFLGRCLFFG